MRQVPVKFLLFLFVTACAITALVVFNADIGRFLGPDGTFQRAVKSAGAWGYVIYVAVYVACTIFLIPGTVLSVGAGFVFNDGSVASLFVAFAVVVAGYMLGSTAAFALGRTAARAWVRRHTEHLPRLGAIRKAIDERGFQMIVLCRLSPLVPYNIFNYYLGTTEVLLSVSALASLLGMAPGSFVYVFVGWAAKDAVHQSTAASVDTVRLVLVFGVGGVVTIILGGVIGLLARRALVGIIDDEAAEAETDVASGERPGAWDDGEDRRDSLLDSETEASQEDAS